MRQAIEMSEAPMSTIHGLMKFEMRNCGMAKETPVTRIAGQISFMPRYPANARKGEWNDQREKWQLPSDHHAQKKWVEAGDACKACDRSAKGAVSDGRGIGDQ